MIYNEERNEVIRFLLVLFIFYFLFAFIEDQKKNLYKGLSIQLSLDTLRSIQHTMSKHPSQCRYVQSLSSKYHEGCLDFQGKPPTFFLSFFIFLWKGVYKFSRTGIRRHTCLLVSSKCKIFF